MKYWAAPWLLALLGMLTLATGPSAAQSGPHGFHQGAGRAAARSPYQGGYAEPRSGAQASRGDYLYPPGPAGRRGYDPARSFPPGFPPPPGAYGGRPAFDGGFGGGDWRAQQDEVRRAVRDGRHVPLSQAITSVRRVSPGHVLDAGMEGGPDGRTLYRLRWATNDGRRIDYLVDAATGAVVGVQGGR
jgi:hypothetical protein